MTGGRDVGKGARRSAVRQIPRPFGWVAFVVIVELCAIVVVCAWLFDRGGGALSSFLGFAIVLAAIVCAVAARRAGGMTQNRIVFIYFVAGLAAFIGFVIATNLVAYAPIPSHAGTSGWDLISIVSGAVRSLAGLPSLGFWVPIVLFLYVPPLFGVLNARLLFRRQTRIDQG